MKKRPPMKPYPFRGAVWEKDGRVYRILSVDHKKDIVFMECAPTRGAFPMNYVHWQDWAAEAKCVEGAGEQFMEKLRKMCLSSPDAKDFEDCCCAKCGEPVAVPEGMDWERGMWCYLCNTNLAEEVREMMGER